MKELKTWFKCWWGGHDWGQVAFDVGRCKRCGVELFTAQMSSADMIAFIKRFRRVA